jgi:hypothetical protein
MRRSRGGLIICRGMRWGCKSRNERGSVKVRGGALRDDVVLYAVLISYRILAFKL